jgi:hypothetical protein
MNPTIQKIQDSTLAVLDGTADALKEYVELKRIEKEVKAAIDAVKPSAEDAAMLFGEKTFKVNEATITVKKGAGAWSYKNVVQHEDYKKKLKAIEEAAKLAAKGQELYDENGLRIEAADYEEGRETISVTI